jgi:hypothetical protein
LNLAGAFLTARLENTKVKQEFIMNLEGYEVWLIIILVLGVIASNIAVLKYSAKFKMPQFGERKDEAVNAEDKKSSQQPADKLTEQPSTEDDKDSKETKDKSL